MTITTFPLQPNILIATTAVHFLTLHRFRPPPSNSSLVALDPPLASNSHPAPFIFTPLQFEPRLSFPHRDTTRVFIVLGAAANFRPFSSVIIGNFFGRGRRGGVAVRGGGRAGPGPVEERSAPRADVGALLELGEVEATREDRSCLFECF